MYDLAHNTISYHVLNYGFWVFFSYNTTFILSSSNENKSCKCQHSHFVFDFSHDVNDKQSYQKL